MIGCVRDSTSASAALTKGARSIGALRARARSCEACPLFARATQTVFGEGSPHAPIVMVGEQPGDVEDVQGRIFVGPAGRYLREALDRVGLPVDQIYLTNAVKHFKWVPAPRGKRRIHSKPAYGEIRACNGWLVAELRLIGPSILVALGAVAAQSLFGAQFRVTKERGRVFESRFAPITIATYHPSALLRMPDADAKARAREAFDADLALVREHLEALARRRARVSA